MSLKMDNFTSALEKLGVSSTSIKGRAFRNVNQRLLESFFMPTKTATGKWVYRGFRWHSYSYGHQQVDCGDSAITFYFQQPLTTFYVYHECYDGLLQCTSEAWPDTCCFNDDIYVFPCNFQWLFTTTHERGFGPYFAANLNDTNRRQQIGSAET